MSFSRRERGEYIRLKIHYFILIDLGKGKINATQAGDVYDLISYLDTAGTTHNHELAENKYYKRALEDWIKALEIRRKRIMRSKFL